MNRQGIALTDRQPGHLTPSAARDYAHPVTGVPVTGFGSPVSEADSRQPRVCDYFFVRLHGSTLYGRGRAGSRKARRPSDRSTNLHGSVHPFGSGCGDNRNQRIDVMDIHAPGASAPLQAAKPAVFQFHSTEVRTVDRDGQIWFVADDVAKALGYRESRDMTRVLDEDEAAPHTMRIRSENGTLQTREVTIISESGLYHALLKSRKREAKPFRKWVTAEVLPAIRRSGRYAVPQDHTPSLVPPGTKLLLTFEADGRCRAEPVPEGAMVVTARQLAEIVEANGYILAKPIDQEFKL
ncbi:BRO family protein [Acidithiobacillus ferruginosus]|uniref:BRO family protein n=1 Tax=Acidithiobacillus ferruginosus TaxID=3063951 RepID=A0ACD5IHJ1_9PROT|nr:MULTISPECIES: BRO family protein [Acidithiobacillus]MBU2815552.1 hypothetical protein [Acidithiobacillus ferruginosus]MCR1347436.1 BRO family protein [Acidithiobacillus ferrooxidans]MCR1355244.1 BRO family protein [Acidithiobacillus ferrooxidans]UBU62572.1 hypothetical protein LDB30_00835 [Acidithiobacillus ferrooxidans]